MIRSWFCVLEEISCPLISTLLKGLPSVFTSADAFKMGPGEIVLDVKLSLEIILYQKELQIECYHFPFSA